MVRKIKREIARRIAAMALTMTMAVGVPAIAAPDDGMPHGGNVRAGDVNIGDIKNVADGRRELQIDQKSAKALIDWNNFSIDSNGRVIFNQHQNSDLAINRVVEARMSDIQGALKANGQIVLINPNGISIGNGATVEARAFIASTRDFTPEQYSQMGIQEHSMKIVTTQQDVTAYHYLRLKKEDGSYVQDIRETDFNDPTFTKVPFEISELAYNALVKVKNITSADTKTKLGLILNNDEYNAMVEVFKKVNFTKSYTKDTSALDMKYFFEVGTGTKKVDVKKEVPTVNPITSLGTASQADIINRGTIKGVGGSAADMVILVAKNVTNDTTGVINAKSTTLAGGAYSIALDNGGKINVLASEEDIEGKITNKGTINGTGEPDSLILLKAAKAGSLVEPTVQIVQAGSLVNTGDGIELVASEGTVTMKNTTVSGGQLLATGNTVAAKNTTAEKGNIWLAGETTSAENTTADAGNVKFTGNAVTVSRTEASGNIEAEGSNVTVDRLRAGQNVNIEANKVTVNGYQWDGSGPNVKAGGDITVKAPKTELNTATGADKDRAVIFTADGKVNITGTIQTAAGAKNNNNLNISAKDIEVGGNISKVGDVTFAGVDNNHKNASIKTSNITADGFVDAHDRTTGDIKTGNINAGKYVRLETSDGSVQTKAIAANGGSVEISAKNNINVSGGAKAVPNSESTEGVFAGNVKMKASEGNITLGGTSSGQKVDLTAGNNIVFNSNSTVTSKDISAVAGNTVTVKANSKLDASATGADGGRILTQGKGLAIDKTAQIHAASDTGKAGTWTARVTDGHVAVTADTDGLANNKTSYLNNAQVTNSLNDTNVEIFAEAKADTINVSDAFILGDIAKSGEKETSLSMNANRNVVVTNAVSSTGGKLNVELNAARGPKNTDQTGANIIENDISTNGGNFKATGKTYMGLNAAEFDKVAQTKQGVDRTIATNGGNISMGDVVLATGGSVNLDSTNGEAAAGTVTYGKVSQGNAYKFEKRELGKQYYWSEAEAAAKSGNGDGAYDTYLATITSDVEDSAVSAAMGRNTTMDEKKSYEAYVGGKTDETGAGRKWKWVTGPEGLANDGQGTVFYTEGDGTNKASASGYTNLRKGEFNDDKSENKNGQTVVAVGYDTYNSYEHPHAWDDHGDGSTGGSMDDVKGYVKEMNLPTTQLNVKDKAATPVTPPTEKPAPTKPDPVIPGGDGGDGGNGGGGNGNGGDGNGGNGNGGNGNGGNGNGGNGNGGNGGGGNGNGGDGGNGNGGNGNGGNGNGGNGNGGINNGGTNNGGINNGGTNNGGTNNGGTNNGGTNNGGTNNGGNGDRLTGREVKNDILGTNNAKGEGSTEISTAKDDSVNKVAGLTDAELPFFRVASGKVSQYGTYAISATPDRVNLKPSRRTLPAPKVVKNQYRALDKMMKGDNREAEFSITYDGAVLNVYPTNEESKSILKAGDSKNNTEIASQALHSSFTEMGVGVEDLDGVMIYIDKTETEAGKA